MSAQLHDAQYAAERRRHPDQLATEVIKLRRQNAALKDQLRAQSTLSLVVPPEYAQALEFAYFVAHDAPVTDQETPGRKHPDSAAPGYNAAAYRALHAEQQEMRRRSSALKAVITRAADHPDA